jgi:hypothetical protein
MTKPNAIECRHHLEELISVYEAEYGEFTDEELAAVDREIDEAYQAMLDRRTGAEAGEGRSPQHGGRADVVKFSR